MTVTLGPDLQAAVDALGPAGLQARLQQLRRLVQDDGVTYGATSPDAAPRAWAVDPLPLIIDAVEWSALEARLEQRARVLDALLADLYGERRVLRERVVPAEVVLGHPGFLAAADGIRLPTRRQLPLVATDLARSQDGAWTVLADRPQAPAGAGYAMANRRLVARVMDSLHRRTRLRHLRGFFDLLQVALPATSPPVDGPPLVVLLSPGPGSETAYDQALLSTLLGFPLVQSDDLLTRGGRLWLRTTARLQAVDVVFRRVDAAWSDSLDLRPDSRLGVPGLVAAARRGTVSVVNPLGAGVLENPGLLPYLDAVSRLLLGEPLASDSPPTWWCGEPAGRAHVLSRLDTLVVKPISRDAGPAAVPGWLLDAAARDALRRRIAAEPWAWAAQEALSPSTVPVVGGAGLEQRSLVLRAFAMAMGETHHVMPGGLARVAAPGEWAVTSQPGSIAKDVWVLESADAAARPRLDLAALARTRVSATDSAPPGLPPRAAAFLFRLGRHLERAEGSSRLLMMADNLFEDHAQRPGTPGHLAALALLGAVEGLDADAGPDGTLDRLRALLVDPTVPGSVAHSARRAGAAASEVGELLSQDTSSVLARLERTLAAARAEGAPAVQPVAAHALESLLALAGLGAESLVRDPIWAFQDAGRRVERAATTVALLRATLAVVRPPVVEGLLTDAVLRVGDSLITHRRRTVAGVGPGAPVVAAAHLLLDDPANPRSVLFQAERLLEALAHAPDLRAQAAVRHVIEPLRGLDLPAVCAEPRTGLLALLDDLESRLRTVADVLAAVYFARQQRQRAFAVAGLAGGMDAR